MMALLERCRMIERGIFTRASEATALWRYTTLYIIVCPIHCIAALDRI